jgi:flagellar export protein FliJ
VAFHFTLQPLLRLWRSRERQERRKLEALAARLGALRAERRRVVEGAIADRRQTGERLNGGMTAAELHFAEACEGNRDRYLAWLQERVKAAEEKHRTQMAAYQAAERECKILENLCHRQFEAFRLEEMRREQKKTGRKLPLGRAMAERGKAEAAPES